ncbi:cell division protein FtsI/penicillin-binding protein 2 [Marmoricola sp. OAE513]|uniref:penicillin-binding transpeptidase domain-containing protein n=1 Tax=Marmoricola sp. OAE513 TaxID=2817894 RepID=UPI001AE9DA28
MTSRLRRTSLFSVPVALVLLVAGCGGPSEDEKGAQKAADAFAVALTKGDVKETAFTTTTAAAAYTSLAKPLQRLGPKVEAGEVEVDGSKATTELSWDLSGWKHSTTVALTKKGSTWQVVWKPTVLEASLKDGETIAVTGLKATRGNIVGANGEPIVEPRDVIRFGIDKAQAAEKNPGADLPAAARRLAALLDVTPEPFVKQVSKAGPKAFVQAIVQRENDVKQSTLAALDDIPGARSIADKLPLAPSKEFAAALLGTVGPATADLIKKSDGRLAIGDDTGLSGLQLRYDRELAGTRGFKVTAQEPAQKNGNTGVVSPRVLFTQEPVDGTNLQLSLDRKLQSKAQDLLDRYGPASALVAIKPSTGEVLVAASGPGSKGYNTATFGQYAPGSTFKIISSLALLRFGMKPTTSVSCPARETVNGKQFKNYSDYPSNRIGKITLRDAVANSCNTAFISSRGKIKGTALADAAASLGFGEDHDIGFPAYFGQVPAPASETEAAADLIGQGKVLASPMAMATVVASVVHGSTVVPNLVAGVDKATASPAKPLTSEEATSLRALMHAVVTDGSGRFLSALQPPDIIAKTGTAEFGSKTPLQTHTWMVGAQGDLAVAVFVDIGESGSQTAGPVLADFLRAAR